MKFYNFIFSDKLVYRFQRHFTFWLAVFIYHFIRISLFFPQKNLMQNMPSIVEGALAWGVMCNMIFSYTIVYYLIPHYFVKKKYVQFIFFVLFMFFITLMLNMLTIKANKPMVNNIGASGVFSFAYMRGTVIRIFGNPPLICLLLLSLKKIKDWYVEETENRLLLSENVNAELQLLKAQIHPHFLFNTLNNIYFFILTQPDAAQNLVEKLESLLFYMINECNAPYVPLEKEIDMINNYLELEKVRYNDLDIDLSITGDYKSKKIAPLLMIPFIENSFKHGSSKMLKNPWIKLAIQADEEMLHFTLINNKPSQTLISKTNGIGLTNVKKRLNLLHPEKHYLVIEPTANTFTVNMQIPLQPNIKN